MTCKIVRPQTCKKRFDQHIYKFIERYMRDVLDLGILFCSYIFYGYTIEKPSEWMWYINPEG